MLTLHGKPFLLGGVDGGGLGWRQEGAGGGMKGRTVVGLQNEIKKKIKSTKFFLIINSILYAQTLNHKVCVQLILTSLD